MTILILEDEIPAAEKLQSAIRKHDRSILIEGPLKSIAEAVTWLKQHPAPELILADIQLADGQSFAIFDQVNVTSPIVFTTAYDEFLLKAFEYTTIDYLLKPIRDEKLAAAVQKYAKVKEHFSNVSAATIKSLGEVASGNSTPRSRIIVRKGTGFSAVPVREIAYFFTVNKVVFLIDRKGARSIVDETLGELELQLDPKVFFRVNRKYLVHIESITRYSSKDKGKVLVELNPQPTEEVVVSQENGGKFKAWMNG